MLGESWSRRRNVSGGCSFPQHKFLGVEQSPGDVFECLALVFAFGEVFYRLTDLNGGGRTGKSGPVEVGDHLVGGLVGGEEGGEAVGGGGEELGKLTAADY